jgi:hypothetical protein
MSTQRFETTVQQTGDRFYIELPFDPDEVWGAKERHYVSVSINNEGSGRVFLDTNGSPALFWFGLSWVQDHEIEAGQTVEVAIEPCGPQLEDLASDIVAALEADSDARAFFESLASYYRRNYIRWIEDAKKPETRSRRIAEMMGLLKAGKKQK